MIRFVQFALCITALNYVSCAPIFGGFRYSKHFEIEHKPPPPFFKPMEFIKEIVTPFGKFGIRHSIGKRDLDDLKSVEAQPEKVPLMPPLAGERYQVEEVAEPAPPITASIPLTRTINPGMGPVIENRPVSPETPPHFVEIKPIPAPPTPPIVISPPPPKEQSPPNGFYTDIAREEAVNEYLKLIEREPVVPVENNIEPEKPIEAPKVEEPPNLIVRGSRLALYFGNVLMDVFSQILGGRRFAEWLNRPVSM